MTITIKEKLQKRWRITGDAAEPLELFRALGLMIRISLPPRFRSWSRRACWSPRKREDYCL